MPELTKLDGRREVYDRAKLARSLSRAGVAPYILHEILTNVAAGPDTDTGSLRTLIESVLAVRQPSAAKRYATTRTLTALGRGSEQAGYGWVCLNPEDVSRLCLRSGDMVWLSTDETGAPYSIESLENVGRGQAWLNDREMAAMGVGDGTKLAASSTYHETSVPLEQSPALGRAAATSAWSLNGIAGHR